MRSEVVVVGVCDERRRRSVAPSVLANARQSSPQLVAKGHEVKVVEGRRRVGGRVNTAQLELSTKKKRAPKQEKETKTLQHIMRSDHNASTMS